MYTIFFWPFKQLNENVYKFTFSKDLQELKKYTYTCSLVEPAAHICIQIKSAAPRIGASCTKGEYTMSVIIKGDTINDRIAEVTTRTLIDMIVEDVIDHVDRLKDASTEESPDSEKVEYHHARIMLRIGQLKGVVIHNGI